MKSKIMYPLGMTDGATRSGLPFFFVFFGVVIGLLSPMLGISPCDRYLPFLLFLTPGTHHSNSRAPGLSGSTEMKKQILSRCADRMSHDMLFYGLNPETLARTRVAMAFRHSYSNNKHMLLSLFVPDLKRNGNHSHSTLSSLVPSTTSLD
jgi:hypothetical protein